MEEGYPWACGPHGCLHRSTHLLTPLRPSVSAPTLAPMDVIEVQGLRKEYRRLRRGRTVALDGLDLTVPEGGVFGFLGPNGAGKTTTIRCLLGLVRASAGRCRLLGAEAPRGLSGVVGRVGSIVDTPALYPRFSARPLDFPSLQRSTLGAGLYLAAAAALVLLCSAMVFRARDVT